MTSDFERLIMLFGYETDGGRKSGLWGNPSYFPQAIGQGGKAVEAALDEWRKSKRAFSRVEVIAGRWVKIGDHGFSFLTTLHPDGSLTEANIFALTPTWSGSWELVGSVLRMRVGSYELDSFANADASLHSGIEFPPDASGQWPTFFKLIHFP